MLLKLADVLDDERRGARARSSRGTSASRCRTHATRCRSAPTTCASSPARRAMLEGKSAGEYMRGLHVDDPPRAARRSSAGSRPWNYPLMMAVWKLAPALAAGNVQVLKPSEQTPLSLLRFVELAQDVIPAGVLNVVTGDGVPVGERIVTHPGRAARLADRRRRDRQDDRADGRRHAQARAPRARRQGAGGRLRRRRPGRGRGGDQDRRLLELGPGLHRRLARRSPARRSTTSCSRSSCRRSSR